MTEYTSPILDFLFDFAYAGLPSCQRSVSDWFGDFFSSPFFFGEIRLRAPSLFQSRPAVQERGEISFSMISDFFFLT